LNSSGKAFPFAKRQTKRFQDSELVSFDPGHLDLGFRRFVPKVRDKLHPPNQLSHRLAFSKEAILNPEKLHTPHNLACSNSAYSSAVPPARQGERSGATREAIARRRYLSSSRP
jgi:hypothetical protein